MFTILLTTDFTEDFEYLGRGSSNQQTMGKSANTLPFLRKGNRGDLCSGNPPVDRKVLSYLKEVIIICHLSLRGLRYYK
jgi:hypothetical protein